MDAATAVGGELRVVLDGDQRSAPSSSGARWHNEERHPGRDQGIGQRGATPAARATSSRPLGTCHDGYVGNFD